MRFLVKALLAATALIPAAGAASAQDGAEQIRRGWSGDWSAPRPDGAPAQERRLDAPAPLPAREMRAPEAQQRQWADRHQDGGGADGERFGGRPGFDRSQGEGRGRPGPLPPGANIAVNRPDGPDRNNPRADRRTDGRFGDRQGWDGAQPGGRDPRFATPGEDRAQPRDGRDGWSRPDRDSRPQFRDDRPGGRSGWDRANPGGRFGDDPWARSRDSRFDDRGGWNRTWRNDRRYDWNGYRATNRSAYRLPRYYAPSGWSYGYRRFSIGATLGTQLWGENYWIDDPYAYRLPAVYGPYRWVRYYDDALLVDLRTGRVVDGVYDIFW